MLRLGYRDPNSVVYRPPCGSRRCTLCQPKVIEVKMERFPTVQLYAARVTKAEATRLKAQLRYQRKHDNPGDHCLIPVDYDRVLVVSDALIGEPITFVEVEDTMFESRSEWGAITFSKAWQGIPTTIEHSEGFVDCGPVSASLEWIEGQAERMGLVKEEHSTYIAYETTPEEHEALMLISGAGVEPVQPESRVEAPHPWAPRNRRERRHGQAG